MKLSKLLTIGVVFGGFMLLSLPNTGEAACACSRIGQSSGYYASPTYGSYQSIEGTRMTSGKVKSKGTKAKKNQEKSSPGK